MLYKWIRKIHTWSGLLTFTAFVVWGLTGIYAIFLPPPGMWKPPEVSSEREFAFEAPGSVDDRRLARLIFEAADIKMAGGHYNVRRDSEQNLAFNAFTPNGRLDFTYIEDEKRVRIQSRRNEIGNFFSVMHAAHSRRGSPHISTRLYGVYNEVSTWAFFFMSLSGLYMWIATRPGLPWARIIIGAATLMTVIMWWAVR